MTKAELKKIILRDYPELAATITAQETNDLLKQLAEKPKLPQAIIGKIKTLKGEKGDKGDKGDKYELTKEDIKLIVSLAKPIKNVDYFEGRNGKDGKDGAQGRPGRDGKDGARGERGLEGRPGKDGRDGRDGSPDSPLAIANKLNTLTGAIKADVIEGMPSIENIAKGLKNLKGKDRISSKDIDMSDMRWHGGGLSSVAHDGTLSGSGTSASPLSVISGGSPLTTKGDIYGYSTENTRIPVGLDGSVLTADSSTSTGVDWKIPGTSGTLTYMFANTASGIASYYQAVSLSSYSVGAEGDITTAGVSTTPTIIGRFATNVGFPNITLIPQGSFVVHYDVKKLAGSNNYYTYAEIYKRTAGGTETLIATTDFSSSSALNTRQNVTVSAFNSSNISLNLTDRIVVKVYGVMVSSTATIDLYFDDSTSARLEMPSALVDATNFVPYTGATADLDLGSHAIITPTIASFVNANHNHQDSAGGGTLAESSLALTDVTTNDATTSKHGFAPKASGVEYNALTGNGTYRTLLSFGDFNVAIDGSFIRAAVGNSGTGNVDIYTCPANKKAVIIGYSIYNPTVGSLNLTPKVKISGSYYRLETAYVMPSNSSSWDSLTVPYVLEAGESFSVTTTGTGLNVFASIVEFDADSPVSTKKLTSFSSGDNTLFTTTTGKSAYMYRTYNPNYGDYRNVFYANDSGASRTIKFYNVENGGSTGSTNQILGNTSVSDANVTYQVLYGNFDSGSKLVINTNSANATQFSYVTIVEI